MKIVRHYSGNESLAFWNAINSIKSKSKRNQVYDAGCRLQNLEELVLDNLVFGLQSEEDPEKDVK